MGKEVVRLKGLPLDFRIRRAFFTDFGFVSSIAQTRRQLDAKYNVLKPDANAYSDNPNLFGEYYTDNPDPPSRSHCYIYFVDQRSPIKNSYTRGHEETHVVYFFRQMELLAAVMEERRRVRIDFDRIHSWDLRAEIGAIFAVEDGGFDPAILVGEGKVNHRFLAEAWELYQASRVPERTIFIPSSTDLELRLTSP